MTIFESLADFGHEQLVLGADPSCGYRGIVAVHSTALGTAVGGTRWWKYDSETAAITDALRLSRGMSFKNAIARLPMGGGKSVIMANDQQVDRAAVLRAHGRLIERLGGVYITAEDVGTSPADMEYIAETTQYVAGRSSGSGDPSPHTARGVFRAIQGAVKFRWVSDDLAGRTVAVQGLGNVGFNLVRQLAAVGAKTVVADIDQSRVDRAVRECGSVAAQADRIHAVPADVFAPCALGAILNDRSIPELAAAIVAGGANNQLAEPRHGALIEQRGITYVPDYVANGGGVSYGGAIEVVKASKEEALRRVDAIYDTTIMVLERARVEGIATSDAADRIAAERIRNRRLD